MTEVPRPYASPLRSRQAEETRRQVAAVAAEMFVRDGYAAATVAGVARQAGVSAQTVYNTFGTKAGLLKVAYDITLVGDAEPVPLAERPDVRALYETPDPYEFLRGYARLGRRLLDRVGPLMLQVHAGAAAGDADLVEHQRVTDEQRLTGTTMVARRLADLDALAPGVSVEVARDRVWTLNSAQVWHLLTTSRGWSGEQYEQFVGEAMCAATLASARTRVTDGERA